MECGSIGANAAYDNFYRFEFKKENKLMGVPI